jgi:hypothetical protein
MSREDDCRIAQWLGLFKGYELNHLLEVYASIESYNCIKHYTTSGSDAIALLPVLVNKGYGCHLNGSLAGDFVTFDFFIRHAPKQCIESVCQPTVAAAITSAVLALIEKEEVEG